jgi:hypothetical protein
VQSDIEQGHLHLKHQSHRKRGVLQEAACTFSKEGTLLSTSLSKGMVVLKNTILEVGKQQLLLNKLAA